ncbi:hypothetical protein A2U01_0050421, partial [Trifolium medium]|nr:hypothetical protein [Trifolium medium]
MGKGGAGNGGAFFDHSLPVDIP